MTETIDQIGKEIIQKTGIDFEKYRKPELIKAIIEVSVFIINPLASIPIFLKSFTFTLFPIIVIMVVIAKTGTTSLTVIVLMSLIGLIGFPLISSSMAVRRVGKKVIEDIKNALNIAMDVTIDIIKDLNSMNLKQIPRVTDIMKGIVFVVLIPSLKDIIAEKITLLSNLSCGLQKRPYFPLQKSLPVLLIK